MSLRTAAFLLHAAAPMNPLYIATISLFIASGARAAMGDEARPVVYVSIAPQAWILEQLGASELADIEVLLPAASGHINYSPTPSQIRKLSRAALFVRSQLPFENRVWQRLLGVNPKMIVVNPPIEVQDHDHHHDRAEDPHFWLDPYLMMKQAEAIAAALSSAIGIDDSVVRKKLHELVSHIESTDSQVRRILDRADTRSFWTFHGSWSHFAERYGLQQHAIEFEGKESGLRTMLRIIGDLERSEASFIIVEPGLDRSRLAVVESEAGLRHVELNPMAREYDRNLIAVATAIAEGAR